MSEINTSGLKARVIGAVNEHAKLAWLRCGARAGRRRQTQEYEPFIGAEFKPPIDLDQISTDRFRPLMQPFYYVSKRYDTYLEQLGAVYPTLERPA